MSQTPSLSPRELEILRYIAAGMTTAEIAERLDRSEETIETHRSSLHRTLRTSSAVELIGEALRLGILQPAEIGRGGKS